MEKPYKTVLHKTKEMHIIAVKHDKTATLRKEMLNQGINIAHKWPARVFYKLHDHNMAEIYTNDANVRYGYEIWPFFMECNANPSEIIALHEEILNDPSIPSNTRILTEDESRIVLANREVFA